MWGCVSCRLVRESSSIISCITDGSCISCDVVSATCDVVGSVVFGVDNCSCRSWVNGYGEGAVV